MSKNLVIVESPAKAKTIEKYLGKDYTVKSSFGHIRDLPKKGISIDIANNFEPTYEIPADKKKIIAELRKYAKTAETVWLASDEDREGEAIAWHLAEALKLDLKTTKRIVFHEITKPAIEEAIANPRTVDVNLVNAQQARRVLDRLVGYELSPVLWKKVQPGLSAGRVQSVAVRLVVEREREIEAFESSASFRVSAIFIVDGQEFKAELPEKITSEEGAQKLLEEARTGAFSVGNIEQKPGVRNPGAPFTTSTLQQEASRRLGFSVRQTMTLAQRLYENGHITYMRTDSTNLSGIAIAAMKDFITSQYGEQYTQTRQFKTKNSSAQEAHEAIRPSNVSSLTAGDDEQQKKLYKLIWQRTIASQMSPAKLDKTDVRIKNSNSGALLVAKGEIISFDGYLRVYGGGKDDVILPDLKEGQSLDLQKLLAEQVFSRPPARYSEATLVRALEEMGIGRPSTYAPTISTIQTRGYVEKGDLEAKSREAIQFVATPSKPTERSINEENFGGDKNKLLPTYLATVTTDFLTKHFAPIVDYDFTAKAENEFDAVAEGKTIWQTYIKDFYSSFKPLVEGSESISRQETSQARILGTDPKSGKPLMARFGRYGPMLQIGEAEDEEKPRFAPMPEGAKLETITFEEALEMFKLPRTVGKTNDGKEIKANIGRFGPYIQIDKLYVSIKPLDPLTIDEGKARELYEAKLKAEAEKNIAEFPSGLKVLKGPYGPYITDGKKNARIPKGIEPESLSEEQCKEMLAAAPDKKKRFVRRKAK